MYSYPVSLYVRRVNAPQADQRFPLNSELGMSDPVRIFFRLTDGLRPSLIKFAVMRKAKTTEAIIRRAHRGLSQTRNPSWTLGARNVSRPNPLSLIQRNTQTSIHLNASRPLIHNVTQRRKASTGADSSGLRQTDLHGLHLSKGGKMVPFGGYSMPVQYSDLSVGESHKWTREKASLFDVGHMYALQSSLQPESSNRLSPDFHA